MQTQRHYLSISDSGCISPESLRQNIVRYRQRWADLLGLSTENGLTDIEKELAFRICDSIKASQINGDEIKQTKKKIRQASKIGSLTLLGGTSLNKASLEDLHQKAQQPDYWQQRLVGEIRLVLSGLTKSRYIKTAFGKMMQEESLHERISGSDGYRRVSELFCAGSMQKAYLLMSAVSKAEGQNFKALGWGAQFAGSTKQFATLRETVRSGFLDLKSFKYSQLSGYQTFADEFCRGDKTKARRLVRPICKSLSVQFKHLEWQ